jgi:protein tyrosine/serine phosphatase
MHETELRFYDALDLGSNGLVGFYRDRGFNVEHIPWEDPAHSKSSSSVIQAKRDEVRQAALEAYDALPNPVLIHCSAGEQRSAPVAAFIWWHVGRRGLTTG